MKVSYSIYEQGDDILLAACDKDLLGATLEEGEIHLEIKENFYGGQVIDVESNKKALHSSFERATIANLVGDTVIDSALEAGFGSEDDIMRLNGIPHLQIVRI